jgi:hypothetical protein
VIVRRALAILLISGCRQILGIDPAVLAHDDAAIDTIPADADRSARKKEIRVSPSLTSAELTGFPLWIAITDLEVAARTPADGSGLHFRSLGGEVLPYEIQRWDSQTGRLEAWVLVDLTATLAFELHYGEQAVVVVPNSSKVFNTYSAVWHFEDDLTTPTILSATGTTNGTATGLAAANRVAGKVGHGIAWGNVEQRIRFDNPISGNASHTISSWIELGPIASYDPVVVLGEPQLNRSRWFHARYSAPGNVGVGMYGNDFDTKVVLDQGTWALVHWVFDASDRVSTIYVDGVARGTYQHAANINTTGNAGYLGFAPVQWGPNLNTQTGMNGTLDEIRIQTTPRSAAWVMAEYKNQNELGYTIGAEALP